MSTHSTSSIGALLAELHLLKTAEPLVVAFDVAFTTVKEQMRTTLRVKNGVRNVTGSVNLPTIEGITFTDIRVTFNKNIAPYLCSADELAKLPYAWKTDSMGSRVLKSEYSRELQLVTGNQRHSESAVTGGLDQGISDWLPIDATVGGDRQHGRIGDFKNSVSITINGFITRVMVRCTVDFSAVPSQFLDIPFSAYADIESTRMVDIYARHEMAELLSASELERIDIVKWYFLHLDTKKSDVRLPLIDNVLTAAIRSRASHVVEHVMKTQSFTFNEALLTYMQIGNIEGCKYLFDNYYFSANSVLTNANEPIDYNRESTRNHNQLREVLNSREMPSADSYARKQMIPGITDHNPGRETDQRVKFTSQNFTARSSKETRADSFAKSYTKSEKPAVVPLRDTNVIADSLRAHSSSQMGDNANGPI